MAKSFCSIKVIWCFPSLLKLLRELYVNVHYWHITNKVVLMLILILMVIIITMLFDGFGSYNEVVSIRGWHVWGRQLLYLSLKNEAIHKDKRVRQLQDLVYLCSALCVVLLMLLGQCVGNIFLHIAKGRKNWGGPRPSPPHIHTHTHTLLCYVAWQPALQHYSLSFWQLGVEHVYNWVEPWALHSLHPPHRTCQRGICFASITAAQPQVLELSQWAAEWHGLS